MVTFYFDRKIKGKDLIEIVESALVELTAEHQIEEPQKIPDKTITYSFEKKGNKVGYNLTKEGIKQIDTEVALTLYKNCSYYGNLKYMSERVTITLDYHTYYNSLDAGFVDTRGYGADYKEEYEQADLFNEIANAINKKIGERRMKISEDEEEKVIEIN